MVHALIHTQGFVLNKRYYVLELAYADVTGVRHVFLLNSPLSFHELREMIPKFPINVFVITENGSSYEDVVQFLSTKYKNLSNWYPDTLITFGYKGKSYQKDILNAAGVSSIKNIEIFGVPSIPKLKELYPNVPIGPCPFHSIPKREYCCEYLVRLFEHDASVRFNSVLNEGDPSQNVKMERNGVVRGIINQKVPKHKTVKQVQKKV